MKKKVYIETSIVSFLTGRPSRNLLSAAWQTLTIEWWEKRRLLFDLYISELVLKEAGCGDEEAAKKRLDSHSSSCDDRFSSGAVENLNKSPRYTWKCH